ncbi:transcriptional regulator, AraC family [Chishuiella changwenlii]|jgi:AraC-like DNA-binding protein|uniref:AraC family transcriptional regulator n=1 Tax=Chishuiella changwenlii TaxID=1434701 RepID=A0A1M6UT11_9FLAO|nr:AraC family transcriptional regulator [Chishuiella changwenlii]GGF08055.1 AraC family transcriptional regulator [Chishuiella changwenlii]SHK72338.1 transcriptional regulator, AraC family [Chishuiella changwenlii]
MDLKNTHKSKIKEYKLFADAYLAQIDNFTDSTESILKGIDKRYIQFYFCTKGSLTFNFNNGIYKINLNEGKSFLFYYPTLDIPLSLNINAESKVYIIVLSIQKLQELFTNYEIENDLLSTMTQEKFYIEREIIPSIRLVLNQVEQMKLSDQFQNLFLIGKMYELFSLYFSDIENKTEHSPFLDNENEEKRIKEIKDFLIKDFKNPPTIKQLCEKFSISEYHLKEGFKEVYNSTIYGYLLDKKLEFALHKLEQNQQMVKDISFEIGYENPSHFISAFKKKYGLTPKQYIKQFK